MVVSTYFSLILTWAWSCLLGELPKLGLIAVILVTAFAFLVFTFGFKIFGKERITINAWRGVLYQRIRSDVERLHRDIIVLKQHLELDNMYEVCYYKPTMRMEYKEQLDLLMQELNGLEDNFYKSSDESSHDISGQIEFKKTTWKGQPIRRVMTEDNDEPRHLRWYNECVRDFYTWIQSTEFFESELRESDIGLYRNNKNVKGNIVNVGVPKESGGSIIFYYEDPPIFIEHCEMQPLHTAGMVGIVMTSTHKSQSPGTPESTSSDTQKTQTPGTPECTCSDTQKPHALGTPESTCSDTQKQHALGTPESTSSDTQKQHALGTPESTSSDTQKPHAPGTPESTISDTQKSHAPGTPKSTSGETQKSHAPSTPESESSDTQKSQSLDMLGNMINDIKTLQTPRMVQTPGMVHILDMLRHEIARNRLIISVLTDQTNIPYGRPDTQCNEGDHLCAVTETDYCL